MWNLAWAAAVSGYPGDVLFSSLALAATQRSAQLTPRGFCNMVWAFATVGRRDVPFLDAMAHVVMVNMPSFSAQDLANTSWAFATLWYRHPPLLWSLTHRTLRHPLPPQELSNLVWSFATLAFNPMTPRSLHFNDGRSDLIAAVRNWNRSSVEFTPRHLANAAWAFAELQVLEVDELEEVFGPLCQCIREDIEKDEKALASLVALNLWPFQWLTSQTSPEVLSSLLTACETASEKNDQKRHL